MRRVLLSIAMCVSCLYAALPQLAGGTVAQAATNGVHSGQDGRTMRSVQAPAVSTATATRWSVVQSPNVSPYADQLDDVSCTERDWCMAVGFSATSRPPTYAVLSEAWNGTTWSVVPTPSLSTSAFQYLRAISCVSSTWCMAVGQYSPTDTASNLAELWNGSSWSQVPTPDVSGDDQLNAVSCVTTSFCMAAGDGAGTLAEMWNGSTWSVIPSPDAGSQPSSDQAVGVSCPSARFCMMLDLFDAGTVQKTATDVWNGASWSAVPTPNPGPATNTLSGVYCHSALSCTAVGYESQVQAGAALVEDWNGSSWSVASTPGEAPSDYLFSVACTTTRRCTAVGDRVTAGTPRTVRTLAEGSRGHSWIFNGTANPSLSYSTLSGVSCGRTPAGRTYCIAVGYRSTGEGLATLIEEYRAH